MSSTFFGLTIAGSGLNASQAQINTTANNISNVNTTGYSKQVVNTVASSALRCYQNYGTTGTGVEATSVTQRRDLYYDEKYWNNESNLGFFEKKQYYMNQIESYYSETTSSTGFSTIYAKMFNSLSSMQGNAGDNTVRKQFISNAKELTEYFNQLSTKLTELQSSINDEVKTAVDDINAIAEKIAILNKQINTIEQGGATANELRDQRALLVDELSKIVNVDVKEVDVSDPNNNNIDTGATYYTVYANGQMLVDTYEFNTLKVVSRANNETYNQCDIEGLYEIVWSKDGDRFNATPSTGGGELKAMLEVRDGNNKENLHAYVSAAKTEHDVPVVDEEGRAVYDENGVQLTEDVSTVELSGLSIPVNELNMPLTGTIWCNNIQYTYKDFNFDTVTDANGNVTVSQITFTLSEGITDIAASNLVGRELQIGNEVDFMGIPYYQNQMNLFLRNFCEAFNTIQQSGVTLSGDEMGAFFVAQDPTNSLKELDMTTSLRTPKMENDQVVTDEKGNIVYEGLEDIEYDNTYFRLTAGNVKIADKSQRDSSIFATTTAENYSSGVDAADLIVEMQSLQSEEELFRGGGGDAFLQCIYADVTVDTQECSIFTTNFTNIQASISQQRMSISGVDEDEEALDLIKFQNAYNLASKCISVFSEIYDRLILETGV
ncbi:MAG: flagellar hook-associated protein FlgK [Pseudobutyrivibrio sp.]|nr:flagellar hook-associated protein FlgK [Pseudobutyrivibrio sp.]